VSAAITTVAQLLKLRAEVFARSRAFFAERGVVGVDTPALSIAAVSDPAIESLEARVNGVPHYLQPSPEFAMKRLLAAGSGDIYQICRVFRDAESGRWHAAEFVMLEWYRLGFDEQQLLAETCALLELIIGIEREPPRFDRFSYQDVFEGSTGIDPHRQDAELAGALEAVLQRAHIDLPPQLDPAALLDLCFSTVVVPTFAADTATVIFDYPQSQAALAVLRPGPPAVARRFEVFFGSVELANGFFELTDAGEQRNRFERDLRLRLERGQRQLPLDEALLDALTAGLPSCAGVALGIDRLVALMIGGSQLAAAFSLGGDSRIKP
jgi:lysyl-tRNA synthetase class 2